MKEREGDRERESLRTTPEIKIQIFMKCKERSLSWTLTRHCHSFSLLFCFLQFTHSNPERENTTQTNKN